MPKFDLGTEEALGARSINYTCGAVKAVGFVPCVPTVRAAVAQTTIGMQVVEALGTHSVAHARDAIKAAGVVPRVPTVGATLAQTTIGMQVVETLGTRSMNYACCAVKAVGFVPRVPTAVLAGSRVADGVLGTHTNVLGSILQAQNSGFWGASTARDILKNNLSIFDNFTNDTAKKIKIQSSLSSLLESNIFDAKTYTSKSPANAAEGLNNLYNQVTAFANVVDLLSEDDPQKITTPVAVTRGAAWPDATHKYVDSQEQQAASVHQLLSLLQATALRVEQIEDKLEKIDDKVDKLPQKHSALVFLLFSLLSCFSGIIFNVFANLVTEHIRANYPEIFPTPTIKKELPLELKSESFFAFGSLLPVERFGYNRVYVNLELLTGARYIVSIPQQYVTATAKTCTDVVARSFPRSRSRVVARLDVKQWVSVHQKKKKWALVRWIDPTSGTTLAGWVPKRQIKKATPQRKAGLA